jgi:hypothetical protein
MSAKAKLTIEIYRDAQNAFAGTARMADFEATVGALVGLNYEGIEIPTLHVAWSVAAEIVAACPGASPYQCYEGAIRKMDGIRSATSGAALRVG